MTKEEILENNKLIAEFMNLTPEGTKMFDDPMYLIDGTVTNLRYHSSWDWLVQVCNKIINEIDKPDFDSDDVDEFFEYTDTVQDNLMICDLFATYKAVVEFIKWYNEES